MSTQERLHETERALGLAYPPSFVSAAQEFSDLIASEGFHRAFGDTRLLLSAPEIANARDSTPTAFLPFMRKENPSRPEIYAFDLRSKLPEFRVVVWSDHAVVMDWDSFTAFIQWVREHIAKHDHAA
jgi:hypothetical protein